MTYHFKKCLYKDFCWIVFSCVIIRGHSKILVDFLLRHTSNQSNQSLCMYMYTYVLKLHV